MLMKLCAAICLAAALAACGSSDDGTPNAAPETGPKGPDTTQPEGPADPGTDPQTPTAPQLRCAP